MCCCIFGSTLGRKCLTRLKPDTARGTAPGLEQIHRMPFSGSFRQGQGTATHPVLDDSAGSPASQPILSVPASTLVHRMLSAYRLRMSALKISQSLTARAVIQLVQTARNARYLILSSCDFRNVILRSRELSWGVMTVDRDPLGLC